ncbi:MAG: Phosphate-starvation-inducible E [Candidatus Accumulibacter appositus]|uniref:Phosphate-starvation-inducible E n=1 Tax=Candidatus Accumulibacter appositus TaxID=1454003 RepID=A0A011NWK5_9PROT|nr:TIGR02647 family protein [Accumulibacter sp.]EXI79741.1 MAG: Phosphate-starvation-inducible E [Candidatus Accumulibacter appositus]HRF05201.1 TIGR02647 family protein [Accumulibacter sp.]
MPFTPDLVDELNILARFDLASPQQGLKIHTTAAPEVVAAAQRLHSKGLLTQVDGGYLTSLGRDAAENAHAALTILDSLPMSAHE